MGNSSMKVWNKSDHKQKSLFSNPKVWKILGNSLSNLVDGYPMCFVALFQHFIQLMLQRKTKKKHRLPNKKQLLSAIYKYKHVFYNHCFTLRNKISPQILATNKNKTSSISVEQTTISISRFFLYWICEKIRSVAACPFFGHDGSTEYNGHIFQLCHTLVEVPLFDGVQKAANTSACHVFTGTSSRNNKSSKLGEADHLPQIGCTSSSF